MKKGQTIVLILEGNRSGRGSPRQSLTIAVKEHEWISNHNEIEQNYLQHREEKCNEGNRNIFSASMHVHDSIREKKSKFLHIRRVKERAMQFHHKFLKWFSRKHFFSLSLYRNTSLSLRNVPPNLEQNLTPRSNALYKRYLISCKSCAFEKTINKVQNLLQMNTLARQYPLKY